MTPFGMGMPVTLPTDNTDDLIAQNKRELSERLRVVAVCAELAHAFPDVPIVIIDQAKEAWFSYFNWQVEQINGNMVRQREQYRWKPTTGDLVSLTEQLEQLREQYEEIDAHKDAYPVPGLLEVQALAPMRHQIKLLEDRISQVQAELEKQGGNG